VALGFCWRRLVAIPLGFVIGMSPAALPRARPVHPGAEAHQPAGLDAAGALHHQGLVDLSGIFVIFICSVWPMLINTAFGVASVRANGSTWPARWR
jgi:nitrate/nitrite transport system permease protein